MRRSQSFAAAGLMAGVILFGLLAGGTSVGSSSAPVAGLTYGAHLGGGNDAWLRLRPDRQRIVSLLIEWAVPQSACTRRDVSSDYLTSSARSGSETGHPITVRNGRFVTRTSEEYSYAGYALVEKLRITGVFAARSVAGTFDVTLVATKRDGPGSFTCTLTGKRWSAAD